MAGQDRRMLETSARLLRLLSLLQARRDWTSTELATRLGVTTRTIRNDVDRLRGLGYPVDARPGVAGGYRLGRLDRRDRGDLGARAGEAAAGASLTAATPGQRVPVVRAADASARPAGGSRRADRDRERVPGP